MNPSFKFSLMSVVVVVAGLIRRERADADSHDACHVAIDRTHRRRGTGKRYGVAGCATAGTEREAAAIGVNDWR